MNIKIKDREVVTFKNSLKAYIVYERLTDDSFEPKGLNQIVTFMYAHYVARSKETILFDEFLEHLDENPQDLERFAEWLKELSEHSEQFLVVDSKGGKRKKK